MDITKAFYETRRSFIPEIAETYTNISGGKFICLDAIPEIDMAVFRNVESGWTFMAGCIGVYADGSIDWDYSTNGSFDYYRTI